MRTEVNGNRGRVAAPLRQEVTSLLRDAIIDGEFDPGVRLPERELCLRFAVSRTVVRESLRQLETEGLIETIANHGPVVAVLRREEVGSLYEVREALEGLAAYLFAQRGSASDYEALVRSVARVEESLKSANPHEWLEAKDAFYDALFEGSHNTMIGSMVRGVHARMRQLRRVSLGAKGRRPETLRELKQILKAIKARDPEMARQAAVAHVRRAHEVAVRELEREERDG